MHKLSLLFFLFISFTSYGQTEDSLFIKNIADRILQQGKAYEHLRVLCKTVGARLAGSPQMYKAERWGVETLQSAGADSVYLQQCMVPRWVRGGKDQAWYSYSNNGKQDRKVLDVLALGNSIGTGSTGVSAQVVLINNFEELEKRRDELKGKIVFYNHPFNPTYIVTGRAYAESGVYRRSGPSRAARYGAVAVVIRSLTQSAADNFPHTGSTSYDSNAARIPCAAMGVKDADELSKLLTAGKKVNLFLRTMAHFLPDTIGHNVIGEMKGSEFPEEYITVGGHLDSWDAAEGAHDDGAGCVQSIEVLRVMKASGYKPKRTIRVVLFANEENGLRGGTRYAEEAKRKNEKHLFALESDAGGFTPRGFGFTMPEAQLQKCRSWLPLLLPYGVYEFRQGGGGADIGPLNAGMNVPIAGLSPDSQRYFDVHHARSDVFELVHKRELELGAVNMAALIYLVDKYGL